MSDPSLRLLFGPVMLCVVLSSSAGCGLKKSQTQGATSGSAARGDAKGVGASDAKARQPLFPFLIKVEVPEPTTEMGKLFGVAEEEKTRWGYMDANGEVVIAPEYHSARPFSEGFAVVKELERVETKNSVKLIARYGVIDRTGKVVVKPRFNEIEDFSGGLAKAMLPQPVFTEPGDKTVYTGFINPAGDFAVPWAMSKFTYKLTGHFSAGRARISPRLKMADAEKFIADPKTLEIFKRAVGDSDMTMVSDRTPKGYMDSSGEMIIAPIYKHTTDFAEGVALVRRLDQDRDIYITPEGGRAFEGDFAAGQPFSDGFAVVYDGEKCGYIDSKGRLVIPYTYDTCRAFSEGFAAVKVAEGYRLINKAGEFVGDAFDDIGPFSDGLAAVRVDKTPARRLWGFIDAKGTLVIPHRFTDFNKPRFRDGLALVEIAELRDPSKPDDTSYSNTLKKSGYINQKGAWVYGPIEGMWNHR